MSFVKHTPDAKPVHQFMHIMLLLLWVTCCMVDAGAATVKTGEVTSSVDSLKKELLKDMPDTLRSRTYARLSVQVSKQNNAESMMYAFKSLNVAYKPGIPEHQKNYIKGIGYSAVGLAYLRAGKFSLALNYLLKSLQHFDKWERKHKGEYAKLLNSLGNVYHQLKEYKLAEEYYNKALVLAREMNNPKYVSAVYNNIGVIYLERDHAKAVKYFKLALEESERVDKKQNGSALGNLSSTYFDMKKIDSSYYYASRALKVGLEEGNQYLTAVSYVNLGKVAMKQKRMAEAKILLLKGKAIGDALGVEPNKSQVLDVMREYYELNNDYEQALDYYEKYSAVKDSLLNDKVYQAVNEAQVAEEINKRDRAIILLNNDREIAAVEIKRETLLRNSLFTGVVLTLILSFTLFLHIRHKRRSNIILSNKNEQIEKQRKEIAAANDQLDAFNKELIIENTSAKYEVLKSKTNPHFLFNSLATLSTIVVSNSELANEYIGRFSELYRRILNTENKSLISLKEEMELVDYYLYIEKVRFEEKLQVNINIEEKLMKEELPPFCIQMMIENAIKHNVINSNHPLQLDIYTEEGFVCIVNNLNRKHRAALSVATGQQSISNRYAVLTDIKPVFAAFGTQYIARLPLIVTNEKLV